MKPQFTTSDVISLTQLTARQLQWWDERGLIRPSRQGHRRLYSWDQLVTAAVISQLRRRGFSLQRVRKVISFLAKEFGTSLAATVRAASEYHLLTDGTHLYLRTSARQVVDLLKNSSQPMFDICLSDEVRRIYGEMLRGEMVSGQIGRTEMGRAELVRGAMYRRKLPSRKAWSHKTGSGKTGSSKTGLGRTGLARTGPNKKHAASERLEPMRRAREA